MTPPRSKSYEEAVVRMRKLLDECPNSPERTRVFLTKLHGEGWEERSREPDAPPILLWARKLLELDERLQRLEQRDGIVPERY